jgi:crossover junction endodeoxyribonuclease RuvC
MKPQPIRIIGIDPGLRHLGWGIIELDGSRLIFVSCGVVSSTPQRAVANRLYELHIGLSEAIQAHAPIEAAVEETFVNRDPQSALKLGQARGVALVVPALNGLSVWEYAANIVKKTVTGSGHAQKEQIAMMVKVLLPQADPGSSDAADALAVAICHAQHRTSPAFAATAGRAR